MSKDITKEVTVKIGEGDEEGSIAIYIMHGEKSIAYVTEIDILNNDNGDNYTFEPFEAGEFKFSLDNKQIIINEIKSKMKEHEIILEELK